MTKLITAIPEKPSMMQLALWFIDLYVNNFIGMAQNSSKGLLRHISRAILILIQKGFFPPHISGHNVGDSVVIKKIIEDKGAYST